MEERLQKFLANSGVASRRKCEQLILDGRIKVNGIIATELGTKINPDIDKIEFNGRVIKPNNEKVYILLNKPIGYVTTMKDQFGRPTVMDLLKGVDGRVVPVGRLDMYTSGALLLSDDGEFINRVTHPKNEIEKTYNVTISGIISKDEVEQLKNGVEIENNGGIYKTKPAKVKVLKIDNEKRLSRVQITIHEGKNREVRKMCLAINKKVLALHRSKIGNIEVKNLPLGNWRFLTKREIVDLYKIY
ncbi:MAG: rRNA pseudouridine synthase [Clostridia bacterium]|nr:rRNA pseudouridine synthase [Clostridia bacterium]